MCPTRRDPTRRAFLSGTSTALAGAALTPTLLKADILNVGVFTLPDHRLTANAYIPGSLVAVDLQTLAATAVDAAKAAGASYADVRVSEVHALDAVVIYDSVEPQATIAATFTYGLRTLVNGTWSFVHGTVPSVDAVSTSARQAVAMAKGVAALPHKLVEFSPAPVVTGDWATPMQLDPFDVPLMDQGVLLGAYRQAAARVRRASAGPGSAFRWRRETRVFASTEGSLVSQTLRTAMPDVEIRASFIPGASDVTLKIPRLVSASGGYEAVAMPGMQEEIQATAEETAMFAQLPRGSMDVGRYPVAVDGLTLGVILGQTLGPALELDRVLGYEADAGGTSYLTPPNALLGTPITSPLLTITANRTAPALSAVRWDDEGVEAREFTVITQGRLMEYFTSRQTAPVLSAWYTKHDRPRTSRGCAVATASEFPVMVHPPHLTVAPATSGANLPDLCREIEHGILLRNTRYVVTDHQLTSGFLRNGLMLEIKHGKVIRRLRGNGIQFGTQRFLKSLVALGDSPTVCHNDFALDKGQPWRKAQHSITAPAALFKDVDILSTRYI